MMKLQILLLFCTLVCGSCQVSQQAQTTNAQDISNVQQQAVLTSDEHAQSITESPELVDETRFGSVKIIRTVLKEKFSLSINVAYPQIKKSKTRQETKFNWYVKKQVYDQISDFTKFLVNKEKSVKDKSKPEYEINLSYNIDYASDKLLSIVMDWNGFTGYLNYDYFPATINYDLKKERTVSLEELFEPKSKYLEKIAEESRKILKRTCLSCGCGQNIHAGDPLPESMMKKAEEHNQKADGNANSMISFQDSYFFEKGTEPKEGNFANWSIAPTGLKITFGEYQVGPGCIGIIDITIPVSDLQPSLRNNIWE